MFIIDENGDTRLQWNRSDAAQIAAARDRFAALKARGFLAYKVEAGGAQGEVLQDFDANEQRIIMVPPMIGG
jgi:hypothetical protein